MSHDTRVAVVVLTHNRPSELAHTLARLRALPEQPAVVVVDNASSDAAAVARLAHHAGAASVRVERNLGAAGRNLGVQRVHTPYVAFCDDDTWWAAGALARACDLLDAHPRVGVINGQVRVGDHEAEDPACRRMAASPLDNAGLPGVALASFMAGAVVMRVQAFREVGGYEQRLFLGAEELLMALDLAARGWHMVYVDAVRVHHRPSPQRARAQRRLFVSRNRVWIAWLRLPWPDVWHTTRMVIADARRDRMLWAVCRQTLAGLPWAWRHRNVVPPQVRDMHRKVFMAGI